MPLEAGHVFAGYTIVRALGSGGMGQVFLATHPRLPRQDALKVLPADVTADPRYRERFEREAELAAELSHPHIVGVHDRGECEGRFWISMDYVAGTDVARLLRDRYPHGMPVEDAMAIIAAVASALDHAHRRGLLHRDVKPANILLAEPDGQAPRVFLADFGIARRIDDTAEITATSMAVGTVAYAAPEQLMAGAVDGRADQYALACTAFHLLAGVPPYGGPNLAVVIGQHVSATPPSIAAHRPELAALDPVFATALAKDPSDRFGSCGEFAAELRSHLTAAGGPRSSRPEPLPAPARRRTRRAVLLGAIGATAALAVAGVIAVVERTGRPHETVAVGPLTGTYRTDFGPTIAVDDVPDAGAPPAQTSTYGLRSVCRASGCVATAARLGGEPVAAPAMVFDQVGGSWLAVAVAPDKCRDTDAEFWQVFRLQPRPDGTLAGEYTESSANVCADKRSVTFTRTGDVDAGRVPDPATQPPRLTSSAQGLHGHYRVSRALADGQPEQQLSAAVTTDCLRTGDRCMSYFHEPSGDIPLVFGGGSWTADIDVDIRCVGHAEPVRLKMTGRYPLPQPAGDPIPRLTGHGHQQQAAPCPLDSDFDETITRTGD
ncbi:serine/threonine-protein kinase [Mycobacterium sp. Marseille-P9652]|uniref:serine/threonine-protein kinase n=1 Tax=Mycobacterium sp. Marseille-P9652 TaxID=2654950 RepID=UPI0012E98433|nr:serine/threonine-protein kinase [Mycobacterium sp. Marseille-P9652]